MPQTDDAVLLRDFCATRDEQAFARLVRRHLPMVQSVAQRRLGSAALAEEVAQSVFTLLARKASAVARHPERLGAWLHRTAYLEAQNLARKEARFGRIPADAAVLSSAPTSANERPETFEKLEAALQSLPEVDRELLLRRYWKGEDFRTIAAALGRTEAACHKRVERSLARLGAQLGKVAVATLLTAIRPSAGAAERGMAERVATTAIQNAKAAGSGIAGAFSGSLLAASVAAGLFGTWVAWPAAEASAPATVRAVAPTRPPSGPMKSVTALTPREKGPRPAMADVLAAIDGGRWAPLIAFLADATPAELRAMLEDRLAYDLYWWEPGDGDYSDLPGKLILQQWAAIDPTGALAWSRGIFLGGFTATDVVIGQWLKRDRAAALQALAQLPPPTAARAVEMLSYSDRESLELVLAAHPKLRWFTAKSYMADDPTYDPAGMAQKIVAGAMGGKRANDNVLLEAQQAFSKWAKLDPHAALAEASRLTVEPLRTMALGAVRGAMPPPSAPSDLEAMPLSWTHSGNVSSLVKALVHSDPAGADACARALPPGAARDMAVSTLIGEWGATEPWRVLDLVREIPGSTSSVTATVRLRGQANGLSGVGIGSATEPSWAIRTALYRAAMEDPQRALAMVPQLAGRLGYRDKGGSAHAIVEGLLNPVVDAWVFRDPAAAMQWAKAGGSEAIVRMLGKSFETHLSPALSPAELLSIAEANELKDNVLWSIVPRLEAQLGTPDLAGALTEMKTAHAEDALELLALRHPEHRDDFLALAAPDFRRNRLVPAIARGWLMEKPTQAAAWVNSLPGDERRLVLTYLSKYNLPPAAAAAVQTIVP